MLNHLAGELYNWIDLLWIPVALLVLPRNQWLEALFVIFCAVIMLRLQVELVAVLGWDGGFTGYLPYDPYIKGLIAYSIIIAVYMILLLVLKLYKWRAHIILSVSVFFNAFIVSSIVMIL